MPTSLSLAFMSKRLVMTTNPLFSIITVTRNNLIGLQKTHKSILCQTCTDYEWIVIDGASNDGTPDFLHDKNAHWISEPDTGIYDAMNKGIARAHGAYLIFMNAGDCFATCGTLALIQKYARHDPDFIYGDALEDKNYKKARSHLKINHGMITHHQSMIYKAPIAHYDTRYTIAADYDLTRRVVMNAPHISYIPKPICLFETGGISQQNVTQGRKEQFKIRKAYNVPQFENIMIYGAQTALYQLRHFAPKLYWLLKRAS